MSYPDAESARANQLAHYTSQMQDHKKLLLTSLLGVGGLSSFVTTLQALGVIPTGKPFLLVLSFLLASSTACVIYFLARIVWYATLVSYTPRTRLNIAVGIHGPSQPLLAQVGQQIVDTVRSAVKKERLLTP